MDKKKIIEYILNTPKNTNKAILRTMLEGLSDQEIIGLIPFEIAETITGEAGTAADVKNIGTSEKPILQFTIPKGKDAVGEPGFSPTFTIEEQEEGYKLTIIDIDKTQDIFIKNGKDGKDGTSIETVEASKIVGIISAENLPSYIDDVIEIYFADDIAYENETNNEVVFAKGKIYIDINSNKIYRYTSESGLIEISSGAAELELGVTEGTAFEGSAGAQLQEDLIKVGTTVERLDKDSTAAIKELQELKEKIENSDFDIDIPSLSVNGEVIEPDENNIINIEIPDMPEIPEVDLSNVIVKEGEQEVSSDFVLKTTATSEEGTESVLAAVKLTENGIKMTGTQVSIEDLATDNATVVIEGSLGANQVIGGVWNDYAEYREVRSSDAKYVYAGRVVTESEEEEDRLRLAMQRLEPLPMVVTDTFGFTIGKRGNYSRPIALAGRVLVYPYENRENYKIGDVVCSGPMGTCSKMTDVEIMRWPDRILGYVSGIPSYDFWENEIPVNGRIWIKLK